MKDKQLHCINASFDHSHGSNHIVKPKFTWLHNQLPTDKSKPVVVIDSLLMKFMPLHEKHDSVYAWLCESSAIIEDTIKFVKENLDDVMSCYKKVFSCDHSLVSMHDRIEFCPSGSNMPWVVDEPKDKTNLVSIIASGKNTTDGHKKRNACVQHCLNNPGFDVYGRSFNPIDRKEEAMLPYMFSLVYENHCYDKYYTEKITDCFATGTVPIYVGTKKICEDFDCGGIIFYDNPEQLSNLTMDDYNSRIDSVKENYNRVCQMKISDDYMFEEVKKFL